MVIKVILSLVSVALIIHILSRKTHSRKRVHALYAYITEGDQVEAHNNFTGWAAMSLSPGTYAVDFYGRSTPRYVPRMSLPSRDTRASRRPLCGSRVEARDHQRSLSSTNRIWHRPTESAPRESPKCARVVLS